ncbi:MAG: hypothetical protein M3Y35_16830 [Actinomycetota bacterium]|nr:hypothetical protein [Actinomycetota bacterium]
MQVGPWMATQFRGRSDGRGRPGRARSVLVVGAIALCSLLSGCATPIAGAPAPVASLLSGSVAATSGAQIPSVGSATDPSMSTDSSGAVPSARGSALSGVGSPGVQPTSGSTTSTTAAGPRLEGAQFAARMKAANQGVTSVKGSMTVEAGPTGISGTFSELLVAGHASAMDMTMFLKQGDQDLSMRMLLVGGKFYLGGHSILAALNVGDKQWALISKTSSNSRLRQLAAQLDGYLTTVSTDQYELYARAAASVQDAGRQQLGGVSAHKYLVLVDVPKMAELSTGALRTSARLIQQSGIKTIPTTIWLDASGRLTQSDVSLTIRGVTTHTSFKISAYDATVVINPPAPAGVYTG